MSRNGTEKDERKSKQKWGTDALISAIMDNRGKPGRHAADSMGKTDVYFDDWKWLAIGLPSGVPLSLSFSVSPGQSEFRSATIPQTVVRCFLFKYRDYHSTRSVISYPLWCSSCLIDTRFRFVCCFLQVYKALTTDYFVPNVPITIQIAVSGKPRISIRLRKNLRRLMSIQSILSVEKRR